MMYTLGQILPVAMVIVGAIHLGMSDGRAEKTGFSIAGAILIGAAYLGLVLSGKVENEKQDS